MKDEIFLMSIEEYEKYKKDIPCLACWWWLRTPGSGQHYAASVGNVGSVYYSGRDVLYNVDCVRPIIKLSKDYPVGTLIAKYGYTWICIDEKLAICETIIGCHYFDENSNIYDDSSIKQYLLNWVADRKQKLGEVEVVI